MQIQMQYMTLLSLGVLCSFLTFFAFSSVSAKAVLPIFEDDEYNVFFKNLSSEEQWWMMELTVLYYDSDKQMIKPFPINAKLNKGGHTSFSSNNTASGVPERLISHFLNGEVPKRWQKEFTKWLTKTYKLEKKNYDQYIETGVFCYPKDSCDLINLKNVGGICCPFG